MTGNLPSQPKATILVVDDEAAVRRVLVMRLQLSGYRVICAEDGEQALEMFHNESPDLVVLDVMLPKLDGFAVCRRLRAESCVPIIFLSAVEAISERVAGLDLGADDYLPKPFSPKELEARISTILRRVGPGNAVVESRELPTGQGVLRLGDLVVDTNRRQVTRGSERINLTCGPLDENIQEIAKKLDIKISRNGFKCSIAGADQKIKIASDMLEHFYLKAKTPITLEDIQLSLVSVNEETDSDDIGLIDLKTKKNGLQGRTPRQQSYLKLIQENDINFGIGPAGTGKTYLAVASAIDALNREKIKRIVLVRPAVEAGEKLGFLPGDLAQKVDPYLRPLYDALYDLGGYETVIKWFEKQIVEIAPLAYMRGRTLNQSFIILDEAQNTTPEQMKMFLTRIGFGTKAVITGDITQIDLTKGQKSGLLEIEKVLKDIKGISFTKFQSKDVVRHPIVQKIIDAYDKIEND